MIGLPVYWRGFEYFADALRRRVRSRESRPRRLLEVPERESGGGPSFRRSDDGEGGGTNCRRADIGGGRGHLLGALLKAAPRAHGVLFDQPHVTAAAQAAGMESERLRVHPGDFFMDALPSADCSHHAGNPRLERSGSRSDSSRYSKGGGARCEASADQCIVPEDSTPSWTKMLDLQMLTLLSGKERTAKEYSEMLRIAGFRLDRVIDVGMSTSILESVAV
jgi:O-methyltransferase domain